MYKDNQSSLLKESVGYIAGSLCGITQVLIGQPFDTVKVRLQSSTNPHASMGGIVKKLLKNDGPKGFYKGTVAPLIGVSAQVSIQFGAYEFMKKLFAEQAGHGDISKLDLWQYAVSGGIGCVCACIVTIPVEHIRIRMQLQTPANMKYISTIDCLQSIFNQYGFKGLYKGAVPALWRDSAMGIQFAIYEGVQRLFKVEDGNEQQKMVAQLVAGGVSGLGVWSIIFPFDTVKSKMQGDSIRNPKIKSAVAKFQKMNLSSLYKGVAPCLLRSVPVNMGGFFVYEQSKKYILAKCDEN